jgi:transcriptional regulator with XRE-family HTH domain
MSSIGAIVKERRISLSVKRSDIVEMMQLKGFDITQDALCHFENGSYMMSTEKLLYLCYLLGLKIGDFLDCLEGL